MTQNRVAAYEWLVRKTETLHCVSGYDAYASGKSSSDTMAALTVTNLGSNVSSGGDGVAPATLAALLLVAGAMLGRRLPGGAAVVC